MQVLLSRGFQKLVAVWVAIALVCLPTAPSWAQAAKPSTAGSASFSDRQYVLRYGDTLNLKVVENEKLTIEQQPIRPDGRVSMPLIGEIQAGGLTVTQLTERVTKAYGRFFVDPHVVINVATFRPLDISIVGLVNKPGTYQVREPIRLMQAIALGGGFNFERADLSNVEVLRTTGEVRHVNLTNVMAGSQEDNLIVGDGDTVRVFEVGHPDWYRILPPLASALSITSTIIILLTRR